MSDELKIYKQDFMHLPLSFDFWREHHKKAALYVIAEYRRAVSIDHEKKPSENT